MVRSNDFQHFENQGPVFQPHVTYEPSDYTQHGNAINSFNSLNPLGSISCRNDYTTVTPPDNVLSSTDQGTAD